MVTAYHTGHTAVQGLHYVEVWPRHILTDWLSRNNHTEDKDQEIIGMNINVNAISTTVNMPVCTSTEDIQVTTCEGAHFKKLKSYMAGHTKHMK